MRDIKILLLIIAKMIEKFCIFIILSSLCLSCSYSKKDTMTQIKGTMMNDSLIIIDLDIKEEVEPIPYSSLFRKVETIFLETKKECLVTQFFKFFAFEDYLFILNQQNPKECLVFNRKGQFLYKIGGIGQGPGEYFRVTDLTIDSENKMLFLNCDRVINKYKIDGTFIGSINKEESVSQFQYYNGKLYLEGRGEYLIKEIDLKTGNQTSTYLESNIYNKGFFESSYNANPFFCSYESPKFAHLFMDTIISIKPDGIAPFLVIKSVDLTTNADVEATKGLSAIKRIEKIRGKNKIYGMYKYFETKNHVSFAYIHGKNVVSIIYDKSKQTYKKGKLCNDLVFYNRHMQNIIYSDHSGMYESYHASVYLEILYDWIKADGLAPNLDSRDELMKLPDDSNPVIFYFSYD